MRDAESLLFITGAGLSADSGLPTYRGIGGLYDDADTDDGVAIEDALSGPMFRRDPALTWKYIRQIEQACRGAEPNEAHRRMAQLEQSGRRVWVLTQNVDGLHAAAGSRNVIDIHGDVHDLHCTRCDWASRVEDYAALGTLLPEREGVPRCPRCDGVVRPRVVLFGEMLPPAATAAYEREVQRNFDVVLSVGTSSLFPYIHGPVVVQARRGGTTIEINPGETLVSEFAGIRVECGAAEAFSAFARLLDWP